MTAETSGFQGCMSEDDLGDLPGTPPPCYEDLRRMFERQGYPPNEAAHQASVGAERIGRLDIRDMFSR